MSLPLLTIIWKLFCEPFFFYLNGSYFWPRMDFLKAFGPLAAWLMRLAIVAFLFYDNWNPVKTIDFSSVQFYLASLKILFAFLLFLGGVLNRTKLTQFAAMIILILLCYDTFHAFYGFNISFVLGILTLGVASFFMANGNKT